MKREILQVYNPNKQLVEISRPPFSLEIIGLEHKNSQACSHSTALESQKTFCLLGPLHELLVSQFELFIHVFGHCRYHYRGHIFLSSKVFCCIDQLVPQSHKLVQICLSCCKIVDQLELLVVTFLVHLELYIRIVAIFLHHENCSNLS